MEKNGSQNIALIFKNEEGLLALKFSISNLSINHKLKICNCLNHESINIVLHKTYLKLTCGASIKEQTDYTSKMVCETHLLVVASGLSMYV